MMYVTHMHLYICMLIELGRAAWASYNQNIYDVRDPHAPIYICMIIELGRSAWAICNQNSKYISNAVQIIT